MSLKNDLAVMLAESHLSQADSLKKRLELNTYMERSSKEVLWATYFAHLHTAEVLIHKVEASL